MCKKQNEKQKQKDKKPLRNNYITSILSYNKINSLILRHKHNPRWIDMLLKSINQSSNFVYPRLTKVYKGIFFDHLHL